MKNIVTVFLIWNIFVFALFGFDKYRAKKQKRRVSEKNLILASLFQGATGGIFAMVIFNHKTAKPKFRILIPVFVIENTIIFYYLYNYLN
ncbi:MAG: DUF1294 domain-containing protein [Clostridia bacterium]|nr:DUF1294 domain-containing protein [Clostridia bacterium]